MFKPVKMLTCEDEDDNGKAACCRHQTKEEKYFPLESPKLTNVSEHLTIISKHEVFPFQTEIRRKMDLVIIQSG